MKPKDTEVDCPICECDGFVLVGGKKIECSLCKGTGYVNWNTRDDTFTKGD